ncbi:unnamed protein product [Phaeothamnion confervicola]
MATGNIPAELGQLRNLTQLSLRSNQLTAIPKELGSLTNLKVLRLEDNKLSGHIPYEFDRLTNLKWFDCTGNWLTGAPAKSDTREAVARWQQTLASSRADAERQRLAALTEDQRIEREAAEARRRAEEQQRFDEEARRRAANSVESWLQSAGFSSEAASAYAERFKSKDVATPLALESLWRDRKDYLLGLTREFGMSETLAALLVTALDKGAMIAAAQSPMGLWLSEIGFEAAAGRWALDLASQHVHKRDDIVDLKPETLNLVLSASSMPPVLRDKVTRGINFVLVERKAEAEALQRLRKAEEEALQRQEDRAREEAAVEAERQRELAEQVTAATQAEYARQLENSDLARWLRGADFQSDKVMPLVQLLVAKDCGTLGMLKVQDEDDITEILAAGNFSKPLVKAFKEHWRRLSDGGTSTVPASASSLGKYVDRVTGKSFGGQSAISFARDPTKDVRVVIKEYPIENLCAFDREREVLAYLQSAARGYVIPMEDVFSGPLHRYLVVRRGSKDMRKLISEKRRNLKSLSESERLSELEIYAKRAAMVLEGIHASGIVWGDVKPENFVSFDDSLVAIDFEGSAKVAGSSAHHLFAVTDNFSPLPDAMQNFSLWYCCPERAVCASTARYCIASPEQDVWSLGMLLYWLVTDRDYFAGREASDIEKILCSDKLSVDFAKVPAGRWRKALELALTVEPLARGTAGEVRRMLTRESNSVLTKSRVVNLVESHLEKAVGKRLELLDAGQRELLVLAQGAAGTMAEIVQGQLNCPKLFLLLEERHKGYLPRPSRWFNNSMRLVFVCAHEPHVVECGPDGLGFLVEQPKEWARKYGPVLQTTLLVLTLALKAGLAVSTTGISGLIPLPDLELIREAYDFMGDVDVLTAVEDMAKVLQSDDNNAPSSAPGHALREVTGDHYRRLMFYMDELHRGWGGQLGGLNPCTTRGGAVAWVCERHAGAWRASDRKPHFLYEERPGPEPGVGPSGNTANELDDADVHARPVKNPACCRCS